MLPNDVGRSSVLPNERGRPVPEDLSADIAERGQWVAMGRFQVGEIPDTPAATEGVPDLGIAAQSRIEVLLCEALADILEVDSVCPTSNFFDDLGADSLSMAHLCARVAKHPELPSLSIKRVYEFPTIRDLAAAIAAETAAEVVEVDTAPASPATGPLPAPERVSRSEYIACGMLQLLTIFGFGFLSIITIALGYDWITNGVGWVSLYVRSGVMGAVYFLGFSMLPIVAKWALVGRQTPDQFPVWSLAYYRFWLVKFLIQSNPLVLFAGTPVFLFYLRSLGAKIGSNVVMLSGVVPACPDLLTIGDGAVVRKDSIHTCYRAESGLIQTGTVTLGKNSFVGEGTVMDINSELGEGAQLGHSSSLHAGQVIPAGAHRVGSPATHSTEATYRSVGPVSRATSRRVLFSSYMVIVTLLVTLPLTFVLPIVIAKLPFAPASIFDSTAPSFSSLLFYRDVLIVSIVVFFGVTIFGLVVGLTVPRWLNRFIDPQVVYPIYGFHFWAQRVISRLTNRQFFTNLFGDTSYVLHYLRLLGYKVSLEGQTGANFGLNVKHDNPYYVTVGAGTMAADSLSIVNAEYSSTSFRLSPVTIGAGSFLGNSIIYPSWAKTGDNCLHATKVLVPLDGASRENSGVLGSPSFEIPRVVERDRKFDDLKTQQERGPRLARKNRHNLVTMGLFVLTRWVAVAFGLLVSALGVILYRRLGPVWVFVPMSVFAVIGSLFYVLVERAVLGFRPLKPLYCSMYDPESWQVERYWKLSWQPLFLNGTPFKSVFWRLLGVKVGRRVFDDGCLMIDKTLITVGDDCVLNAGAVIQPHSQEDGSFKSDHVAIGDGCSLGIGSLVHYGVTMGEAATLDAHSFLMKGTEIAPHTHWGENPARQISDRADRDSMVAANAKQ